MVQVGDWVRLRWDSEQGFGSARIPSEMMLVVMGADNTGIFVKPPFEGAEEFYRHNEYDVVSPPYTVGDPPAGTVPGWVATTSTSVTIPAAEPDMVREPPHYKIKGDLEVIDVIEALAKDDAWYANAIKYLLRAKKKGKLTEDLGKCKFYIDRMLRDAESEAK